MPALTLKRQFIADAEGNPLGVLLPLNEYQLVEPLLRRKGDPEADLRKLRLMEQAPHDPLFMADLHDSMRAFAAADDSWPRSCSPSRNGLHSALTR
jgi:hypothetical protein